MVDFVGISSHNDVEALIRSKGETYFMELYSDFNYSSSRSGHGEKYFEALAPPTNFSLSARQKGCIHARANLVHEDGSSSTLFDDYYLAKLDRQLPFGSGEEGADELGTDLILTYESSCTIFPIAFQGNVISKRERKDFNICLVNTETNEWSALDAFETYHGGPTLDSPLMLVMQNASGHGCIDYNSDYVSGEFPSEAVLRRVGVRNDPFKRTFVYFVDNPVEEFVLNREGNCAEQKGGTVIGYNDTIVVSCKEPADPQFYVAQLREQGMQKAVAEFGFLRERCTNQDWSWCFDFFDIAKYVVFAATALDVGLWIYQYYVNEGGNALTAFTGIVLSLILDVGVGVAVYFSENRIQDDSLTIATIVSSGAAILLRIFTSYRSFVQLLEFFSAMFG